MRGATWRKPTYGEYYEPTLPETRRKRPRARTETLRSTNHRAPRHGVTALPRDQPVQNSFPVSAVHARE
jgi:hypothetical protein